MEKVRIEETDSYVGPAAEKRPLTEVLGADEVAINYYELAPGDSFAFGYHAHEDQEEVFYVQSGTVTFETAAGPIDVGADEAIRFAPGEYQRGTNEGTDRVVALAIGAPRESGETDVLRDCADCGERTAQRIEMTDDRDVLVTLCDDCCAETGRFT